MSMFTGLTNQITGMVAQKLGKGGAEGEAAEGEVPVAAAEENGEEVVGEEGQQQAAGGVSGLAQGLMMKAMSAKDGIKEKAAGFNAEQVKGMGMGLMANVQNLIPGRWVTTAKLFGLCKTSIGRKHRKLPI